MSPGPVKLLAALRRAVEQDEPIPDGWREPLVELVALLLQHRSPIIAQSAVATLLEMEAANMRQDRLMA